jgi:hypothetical protein
MASVFKWAPEYAKLVPEVAGAPTSDRDLPRHPAVIYYVPERLTRTDHFDGAVRRSPEKSECFVFIWRSPLESGGF